MKRIVLTALSGVPADYSGGPNKVINQIISKIDKSKFKTYYLSKNSFYEIDDFVLSDKNISRIKNKLTTTLFNKNYIYQKIFTSSPYLKLFFNNSIKKISAHLNNKYWDIIHSHDVRSLFGLKEKKSKIILSIHSKGSIVSDMNQLYGNRNSLSKLYNDFRLNEIKSLEFSDVVTFPSKAARDLFFDDIGNYNFINKVEVVYNGIDLEKIYKIGLDNNFISNWEWLNKYDYRILTVGSHIKAKNIDKIITVLNLLHKMKNGKYFLVCVGAGPLTNELKKLAHNLNVSNYVLFVDFLANEDVLKLMKYCNIYLSLSERVIFDLVILEALASGMNVFASNDGGNKEIINNSNGCLVNIEELDTVAETILNSKLDYSEMAKESIKNYSITNMINRYLELYE